KVAPKKQPGDYDEYPEIPLRGLGHRPTPLEVRLLKRGELRAPGDDIKAGLPSKLAGKAPDGVSAGKWRAGPAPPVASHDNLITARVIATRVGQGHFGEGLVRPPNDFGVRGERPTHPELLDWLATQFIEDGWSLKKLHRRILLSATYQMSSAADPVALRLDP